MAAPLAEWMAEVIRLPLPDWICSVPSDRARERQRGYNTSELLALELSSLLEVPYRQLLRRTPGRRPPQEGADYELRWLQVDGLYWAEACSEVLRSTVWVVDDVMTTGATLSVCAKVLREQGAARVFGLALATTPPQMGKDASPAHTVDFQSLWV